MANASAKKTKTLRVEVAYALPESSRLIALDVVQGTCIEQAIKASGIIDQHPEIDLATHRVGIFGRLATLNTPLMQGDRVEIYRPLTVDPKTARRLRAENKR